MALGTKESRGRLPELMMHTSHDMRILAIDLRTRQFGYAVFEGQKLLLDLGRRTYPGGDLGAETAGRRVADLLRMFHPFTVVIQKERRTGLHNDSDIHAILNAIRREADDRMTPLCFVTPEEIKAAFQVKTKDKIAQVLAGIFPELLWKIPPKRKTWNREHPRVMVFDAIAAGFAYLQRNGTRSPPSS